MDLLSDLLEHVEKHPRIIALCLLGVIAVGALTGGLWINNLQASIEYRDAVIEQKEREIDYTEATSRTRLDLAQQMYEYRISNLMQENILLSNQLSLLEKSFRDTSLSLAQTSEVVSAIDVSRIPEPYRSKLALSANSILKSTRQLELNLDRMQMIAYLSADVRKGASGSDLMAGGGGGGGGGGAGSNNGDLEGLSTDGPSVHPPNERSSRWSMRVLVLLSVLLLLLVAFWGGRLMRYRKLSGSENKEALALEAQPHIPGPQADA